MRRPFEGREFRLGIGRGRGDGKGTGEPNTRWYDKSKGNGKGVRRL
jgi:hypothetical protein